MTVCTASISRWLSPAGEQPVVIVAMDRMFTIRDVREYETSFPAKTEELGKFVRILLAGTIDPLLERCPDIKARVQQEGIMSVRAIARVVAEEYRQVRGERNARRVLGPHGLTMKSFHEQQKQFADQFVERMIDELEDPRQSDLGISVIVAGIDESGAHVYQIEDPGQEEWCDGSGYAAIGIGAEYAEATFMAARYSPQWVWTNSLLVTYEAKKKAEVARGVGYQTDLYIITRDGGAMHFDPFSPLQQQLITIHNERELAEIKAFGEDHEKLLKIWGAPNAEVKAQDQPEQLPEGSEDPAADATGLQEGAGEGESQG